MSTMVNSSGCISVRPRIPEKLRAEIEIGPWILDDESDREEAEAEDDESVLSLPNDCEISYGSYHFVPDALARILSGYLLPGKYQVNGYASINAEDFFEEYAFDINDGVVEWTIRRLRKGKLQKDLISGGMTKKEAINEVAMWWPTYSDDCFYKIIKKCETAALAESNALAKSIIEAKRVTAQTLKHKISGKDLGHLMASLIRNGFEDKACEFWQSNEKALSKMTSDEWCDYLSFVDFGDARIPTARQLNRWGAFWIPAQGILTASKLYNRLTGSGATLLMVERFAENLQFDPQRLSGTDWTYLLRTSIDFDDQCQWEKLNGRDWSSILALRPELVGEDSVAKANWWESLSDEDWIYLLAIQPKLKKYRPKFCV